MSRALIFLVLLGCGDETRDSHLGDPVAQEPCGGPARIEVPVGQPTGYVVFGDGSVNRAAVVPVDPSITDAMIRLCQDQGRYPGGECALDGDCGDSDRDRCVYVDNEFVAWCECATFCSLDSDCGAGEVCVPPAAKDSAYAWPECAPAGCTTDADCASGECGVASMDYQSERYVELGCRTPGDNCRTNADCRESVDNYGNLCAAGGGFHCINWHPVD